MHKSLGPHANDDLTQMYQVYQVVVSWRMYLYQVVVGLWAKSLVPPCQLLVK